MQYNGRLKIVGVQRCLFCNDGVALWEMKILPRAGVELLNYTPSPLRRTPIWPGELSEGVALA